MGLVDTIIVGSYLLGMLAMGLFSKDSVSDMDDFILGGRSFNIFALAGTIMATMVGSGMTMGSVGNAYENGILGNVPYVFFGFAVGLFTFGFISSKIRKTGKRTMAEVISSTFGKSSRLISSLVIIGYAVAIVAINIAGIRTIIFAVFGDSLNIPVPVITALATALAIFYTSVGGLHAVAKMDTIQLGIIVIGILIFGPIIGLKATGGFTPIAEAFTAKGSSMTQPFMNGISSSNLGFVMAYFLTVIGDPAMPQRALAGKDDKTARNAFLVSSIMAVVFGTSLLLIGGAAYTLNPELANPEHALVSFIVSQYPTVLKGITLVGVFGAVISSFDSFLILGTTHLVYDVGEVLGWNLSEEETNKALSKMTIVLGIVGLIIALFIHSLFDYLAMVFSILGSALVPTFISGLYFPNKVTTKAANASMVVGTIVPAVLYLTVGYDVFLGDPVFLGIISSTVTLVIVSMFTERSEEQLELEKIKKENGEL